MGLSMPGRGVQAPTLGNELDSFQVQALDELGWNTVSPNNAGNAATAGLINPREVAGVEIDPPYLLGHEFMLPGVLRFNAKAFFMAIGPVAGTNLQFRLIVSKDELPQTKMVVKRAQLADIEGSHLYG